MNISQSTTQNLLLGLLSADDYLLLQPHLTRIALPLHFRLCEAGRTVDRVYFPEDGVVSIVSSEPGGKQIEVGLFGREGMSGTAVILGTDHCPYEAYMQIAGEAGLWISTVALQQAMQASPTLKALLLRYVQAIIVQSASSTTAAAAHQIEQRLARWLLMCHDRVIGDTMYLTQDFMAMMLGSRRPSVTLALHILEGQHLIVSKRHNVVIRDRAGLERLADSSYGFAEAEYQRLFGISPCHSRVVVDQRETVAWLSLNTR